MKASTDVFFEDIRKCPYVIIRKKTKKCKKCGEFINYDRSLIGNKEKGNYK